MYMRKTKQIAALMMAAAMALTACSGGAQTAQSSQAGGTETLIFGKKTAQSLKNKALCRSVYIGYTALFFKLKKFF